MAQAEDSEDDLDSEEEDEMEVQKDKEVEEEAKGGNCPPKKTMSQVLQEHHAAEQLSNSTAWKELKMQEEETGQRVGVLQSIKDTSIFVRNKLFRRVKFITTHQQLEERGSNSIFNYVTKSLKVKGDHERFWADMKVLICETIRKERNNVNQRIRSDFAGKKLNFMLHNCITLLLTIFFCDSTVEIRWR